MNIPQFSDLSIEEKAHFLHSIMGRYTPPVIGTPKTNATSLNEEFVELHKDIKRLVAQERRQRDPESFEGICDSIRRSLQNSETLTDSVIDAMSNKAKLITSIPEYALREVMTAIHEFLESLSYGKEPRMLMPRATAARCALRLMSTGVCSVDSNLCELCLSGVSMLTQANSKTEKKSSSAAKELSICTLEFFKDLAELVKTNTLHFMSLDTLPISIIETCLDVLRNGAGKLDSVAPYIGDIISALYWGRRDLASLILRKLVEISQPRQKISYHVSSIGVSTYLLLKILQYNRGSPDDVSGLCPVSLRQDSEEMPQASLEDSLVTASDVADLCDLKTRSKVLVSAIYWVKTMNGAEACILEFLSWILQGYKNKEKEEADISSVMLHFADDLLQICELPEFPAGETAITTLSQFCVATLKSPEISDSEKADKWRSVALDVISKIVVGVHRIVKKLKEHTPKPLPIYGEELVEDIRDQGDLATVNYSLSQLCTTYARRIRDDLQREAGKRVKERDDLREKVSAFISLLRSAQGLSHGSPSEKEKHVKALRVMWARSSVPESIFYKDRASSFIKIVLDSITEFPNLKHRAVRHLGSFVVQDPGIFVSVGSPIISALADASHHVRSAAIAALQQITGGSWEGEDQILELSATVTPLHHQQQKLLQQLVTGVSDLLYDTVPTVSRAALSLLGVWLRGSSLSQFPELRMRACWKLLAVFTKSKDEFAKNFVLKWFCDEWIGRVVRIDGKESFVEANVESVGEELISLMQNCFLTGNVVDLELLSFPGMFSYLREESEEVNPLVPILSAMLIKDQRITKIGEEITRGFSNELSEDEIWKALLQTPRTSISASSGGRSKLVARLALMSSVVQVRPDLLNGVIPQLLQCLQPVSMIGNEVRSPVIYHALSCLASIAKGDAVGEEHLEEASKHTFRLLKEYQDLSRVLVKMMHGCCECLGAMLHSLDQRKGKGFSAALLPLGDLVVRGLRNVTDVVSPSATIGPNVRLLSIMCSIVKSISLYKYHIAFKNAVKDAKRLPTDTLASYCSQSTGLVGKCLETFNKILRQRKTEYKYQQLLEPFVAKAIMGILGHAPLAHAQIIVKELGDWLIECSIPAQVQLLTGIHDYILLECGSISDAQQRKATEVRTPEFATLIVSSVHRGVSECMRSPAMEVRAAATELVKTIIVNRFSPPILFVEAIVIGTSFHDTAHLASSVLNQVQGIDTHIVLNVDVMTCAYNHQHSQGIVPRGFTIVSPNTPMSIASSLFTTLKSHKHPSTCRKSVDTFLQASLRKAMSLKPPCEAGHSSEHVHVVQFIRFVVESVACLPFEYTDEVLFLINAIDSHVNVHGEECLRDLFPHVSAYLPDAVRKQYLCLSSESSTTDKSKPVPQTSERAYSVIAFLLLKNYLKSEFNLLDSQITRYKEIYDNHSLNKKSKLRIDEEKNFAVGQRNRPDVSRASQCDMEDAQNDGVSAVSCGSWTKFESTLTDLLAVAAGDDMRAIAGLLYMTLNSHLQVELVSWRETKGPPTRKPPPKVVTKTKKRIRGKASSQGSSSGSNSSSESSSTEDAPAPKKSKTTKKPAPKKP